jgi:hypothetical protein
VPDKLSAAKETGSSSLPFRRIFLRKIRGHHTSFSTSLVSRLFVVSILYPVFLPIVQQIFYSQTIALFISVKKGHRFALQPFFVISHKRGE